MRVGAFVDRDRMSFGIWKIMFTMSECQNESDDSSCRRRIGSRDSILLRECLVFSVTPKSVCSRLNAAEKNSLRRVWPKALELLRQEGSQGSGSFLWRHTGLSGGRGAAGGLYSMRDGPAGATGLARGQSVLHQTLCVLRGKALSSRDHQGRVWGTPFELAHS